ncbi:MAG TPA: SMI1/KNR4 family protein [Gemmataceae bacterium]|nr:SMI1/KNR4 family protein [Gemmataceae bacterium]
MTKIRTPLQRLQDLIPPPEQPTEAGSSKLRRSVERALGSPLPTDLYEFALVYGSGRFHSRESGCLLQICNPFSGAFFDQVVDWANLCRDLKKAEGDSYIPYDLYPERPGLLALGDDDNGRFIFWLTEGEPDEWPILVWPLERQFKRIDKSLNEFLYQLFSGTIDCWGGDKRSTWFKTHRKELAFSPVEPISPKEKPTAKKKPADSIRDAVRSAMEALGNDATSSNIQR